MFERFTQPARDLVVAAERQAREHGAARLGSEYLLLGLAATPDGRAAPLLAEHGVDHAGVLDDLRRRAPASPDDKDALDSIGIDLDAVRDRVEDVLGAGALGATRAAGRARTPRRSGHVPFDPRAKKVLELALREAVRRGDRHIGTEHVLLGMLHRDTGPARELLTDRGLTLSGVRGALGDEDRAAG